jgi:hypothetical protein
LPDGHGNLGSVFRFVEGAFFLPDKKQTMMWPSVGLTTDTINGTEVTRQLGVYQLRHRLVLKE